MTNYTPKTKTVAQSWPFTPLVASAELAQIKDEADSKAKSKLKSRVKRAKAKDPDAGVWAALDTICGSPEERELKPCIVSFSGLDGAGKDTMTNHLVENYGFVRLSFSHVLKDVVAALFGWDRALIEGDTEESRKWRDVEDPWWAAEIGAEFPGETITPRWAMTEIGTRVMRDSFHYDIWKLAAKRQLSRHLHQRVVFSDARFLNELQMLKEYGGISFGVQRKIPADLRRLYSKVDDYSFKMHSCPFMETDTSNPVWLQQLAHWALAANTEVMRPILHESQLQHLMWPHYSGIIDNRKSVKRATAQVDKLLKDKGII